MKCGVINAFDGITVKKPSKWKQDKNKARYVILAATKIYKRALVPLFSLDIKTKN